MALVRIAFASKNFETGLTVKFTIYNKTGLLIRDVNGIEWATTGVYYRDENLSFTGKATYLAIAEDVNGSWKSARLITPSDAL
jgi:hypothetical protein